MLKKTHEFTGHSVLIEQDGHKVVITVLQDQAKKQYTFTEAYAMMKQGKWMMPVGGPRLGTRVESDGWVTRDSIGIYPLKPAFDIDEIEAQWIEVRPGTGKKTYV